MYAALPLADPGWADRTAAEMARFADDHRDELTAATQAGRFPADIYREMGRLGWVGPLTPVADGGSGHGVAEYCVIEEEVGRQALVSPQISIQGQRWLLDWGTPAQRERYLTGIASGQLIFSESISEPGVGSSLREMRATATRDGDDWVLHGHKTHVNLGAHCDVTLFYAVAPEGLTAFLVDTDLPGVTTRQTRPIGLRLIPTADVELADVRVPADAVLGEPGRGLDTFLTTFNTSRLGNASELIGMGRRALALATEYARERRVGDSLVTDFQGIRWTLADAFGGLYAAALARDHAAALVGAGAEHALATSLAKKLAIDAAERAVEDCFALIGGHGLYEDTDFGQLLHDVKVLRIAGGSVEVLRNHVAKRILGADDLAGLSPRPGDQDAHLGDRGHVVNG